LQIYFNFLPDQGGTRGDDRMLVAIECGCGNKFELVEENSWGKAQCPRCGSDEQLPGIDTGTKLLQVTPQVWKLLCACGQKLKLPRKMGGHRFQCPKCKVTRKIPLEPPKSQKSAQTDATLIAGGKVRPVNRMMDTGAVTKKSQKDFAYESPPAFSLDTPIQNHREATGGLGPLASEEARPEIRQSNIDLESPWDADFTQPPRIDPQGIKMTEVRDIVAPTPPAPGNPGPVAPVPGNPLTSAGPELLLGQLDFSEGPDEALAALPIPRKGTPLRAPGAQENLFDLTLDGALGFTNGDAAGSPAPVQASPLPAQPLTALDMDLGGLSFENAGSQAAPPTQEFQPEQPQPDAPVQGGLELGDVLSFANGPEQAEVQTAGVCPGCSSPLAPGAVICIQCGFNVRTGQRMGIPTMAQGTDPGDSLCGLRGDLVSYFNTTGGIDAAKAGISQVLNGGWLYLPVALIGVLIWEAQLLLQGDPSVVFAFGFLGLTIVVGTLSYSGIIACVRDGIFQTEFGIKRLGYNSVFSWPAMIIGSLLNIPFVLLIGGLSFIISWVMAAGMGPGAVVAGFVIAGGGVTWFMFMSLLFPVAMVFEGGNPIEQFKNVITFGFRNALQIATLAVAQIVISLGVLFTFWMLHFLVGGLIGNFLPVGLWTVIKKILGGFLFAELFGLAVSSVAMLYLSSIEDGSRLTAMGNRVKGPEANPMLTKIVLAVMAVVVIGLSFTIQESKFYGGDNRIESGDGSEDPFFDGEEVEDWEAKLIEVEKLQKEIPAVVYEKMKAEIQKRIEAKKQGQRGEAQGQKAAASQLEQASGGVAPASDLPPSEPPAKAGLPPTSDPADFE